jgi:hypothetical protein
MPQMRKAQFYVLLFLCLWIGAPGFGESHAIKRRHHCISGAAIREYILSSDQLPRTSRRSLNALIKQEVKGNTLVVEADSQLLIFSNPFDLQGKAIHLRPSGREQYTYSTGVQDFDGTAVESVTLKDDDSYFLQFKGFDFPFAGKLYDGCFINSNGNITFNAGDLEPPNLETLLQGPPRIAPFFADLDPEHVGAVFVRHAEESLTVTWFKVPEFFNDRQFDFGQNTFQAVLHRDGNIDLVYSSQISATQALVGVTTGEEKSSLRLVDFSKGTRSDRPSGTLVENFHQYESINLPQLMQSIYKNNPDHYDFVSLFSNFDLNPVPGTPAFSVNVQNDVLGIGNPGPRNNAVFHDNRSYGSAGKLQNITFLGNIHQYPSDPEHQIPGNNLSLMQVLAHEVAHRWLAYISYPRDGKKVDVLIGRDDSHWSFFYNSDGSFLEGNAIVRKSQNSFATGKPFQRYSELDLYLMGFLEPARVRESFVVEDAHQFSPDFQFSAESAPEAGVSFRGSSLPVRIDEVIAANGPRKPDASSSQKTFRHLFVLITKKANPATRDDLNFLDLVQSTWIRYFANATSGKGQIQNYID